MKAVKLLVTAEAQRTQRAAEIYEGGHVLNFLCGPLRSLRLCGKIILLPEVDA